MQQRKNFIRRKEDFVCEYCGRFVHGSGYTNHCPYCLWSKHVDNIPGDRAESCGGLMEPIAFELKKGKYYIIHRCLRCGQKKKTQFSREDNFEVLVNLPGK